MIGLKAMKLLMEPLTFLNLVNPINPVLAYLLTLGEDFR